MERSVSRRGDSRKTRTRSRRLPSFMRQAWRSVAVRCGLGLPYIMFPVKMIRANSNSCLTDSDGD